MYVPSERSTSSLNSNAVLVHRGVSGCAWYCTTSFRPAFSSGTKRWLAPVTFQETQLRGSPIAGAQGSKTPIALVPAMSGLDSMDSLLYFWLHKLHFIIANSFKKPFGGVEWFHSRHVGLAVAKVASFARKHNVFIVVDQQAAYKLFHTLQSSLFQRCATPTALVL